MKHAGVLLGTEPRAVDRLAAMKEGKGMMFDYPVRATASSAVRSLIRTTGKSIEKGVAVYKYGMIAPTSSDIDSGFMNHPSASTLQPPSPPTKMQNLKPKISSTLSSLLSTLAPSDAPSTTTFAASTTTTTLFPSTTTTTTTTEAATTASAVTTAAVSSSTNFIAPLMFDTGFDSPQADASKDTLINSIIDNIANSTTSNFTGETMGLAEALTDERGIVIATNSCNRTNIMGSIVQDSAPYLYPFIIQYSLIGAAVIYVMWKHIGRYSRWQNNTEQDIERRLEAMLSRRAVALAHVGEYISLLKRSVFN